jgi:hypothetical protein
MAIRWHAVVDAVGALVSSGTVIADPLPEGLTAVPVDGPGEGRPWDPITRAWGERLPAEKPTTDPGLVVDRARLLAIRDAGTRATTISGLRASFLELLDTLTPPDDPAKVP